MRKPILAFCADLQARESAYRSVKELKGDDLYALKQVVDTCLKLTIPLILGGDQVDTPTISDEHTVALRKELARMQQPVWYVDGNHERGFKRLSLEGGVAAVAVNLEDAPVIIAGHTVRGFNWRPRKVWEAYLAEQELQPADIVILHGFAEQVIPWLGLPKDEKPICDMDLDWFDGRYRLALMGDIHMEWDHRGAGGTRFLYSGSMWMHRVGEPEAKSFLLVYDDLSIERVPLKCRPYLHLKATTKTDLENTLKWVDNVKALPYISELQHYTGAKVPRIHVVLPTNMDADTAKLLQDLEEQAFVFKKIDHSHDQDLTEIKGSLTEKIDLATALRKLLNESDEIEAAAITFIQQAMEAGFDIAVTNLKLKVGI